MLCHLVRPPGSKAIPKGGPLQWGLTNSSSKIFQSGLLDNASIAKPIDLLACGTPVNYIYFDEKTGDMFVSESGGPLEKADPYTKALFTGEPFPYPEDYSPLPSASICAEPELRLEHDAIVNDMLDALFDSNSVTVKYLGHPAYQRVKNGIMRSLHGANARGVLSGIEDSCDQWDLLVNNIIDYIDEIDNHS